MFRQAFFMIALWFDPGPSIRAGDVTRFPPEFVCVAQIEFAEAHILWLQEQCQSGPLHLREWYGDWLYDAQMRTEAWRMVRRARSCWGMNNDEQCVRELEMLQRQIGWPRYAAGQLPSPVPLWRFTLVDW